MSATTSIIILAAGSSSRLGESKQLLEINGESLLKHAVNCAVAVADANVILVLGARAEEHRKVLDNLQIEIVINPNWKLGIGSSIKAGVQHAINGSHGLSRVLLMVCDQPMLTTRHLQVLITRQWDSGKPIVASFYGGDHGTPVVFDQSLFMELLELPDATGAKRIIEKHRSLVFAEPFPGGDFDIDTVEDVIRLRKQLNWPSQKN